MVDGIFHNAHEVYAIPDEQSRWEKLDALPKTARLMVVDVVGRPAYLGDPVRRNPAARLVTKGDQEKWVGTLATEELAQYFAELLASQVVGYTYEVRPV